MKAETRLQRAAEACDMNRADIYQALYDAQEGDLKKAREYLRKVRTRIEQITAHLDHPTVKEFLKQEE